MKTFLIGIVAAVLVGAAGRAAPPEDPPDPPEDPSIWQPANEPEEEIEAVEDTTQTIVVTTQRSTRIVNLVNKTVNKLGRMRPVGALSGTAVGPRLAPPAAPPGGPPAGGVPGAPPKSVPGIQKDGPDLQDDDDDDDNASTGGWRRAGATAGDMLTDVQVTVEGNFADVSVQNRNAAGEDLYGSVFVTAVAASVVQVGVGYARDDFAVDGWTDIDQDTDSLTGFANYFITDEWSAGVFVDWSRIDFEGVAKTPAGVTLARRDDRFDRWGVGALVSYNKWVNDKLSFGATTSLSSMNKQTLWDVMDNEDSIWLTVVDTEYRVNDWLAFDGYASYTALLDNERPAIAGESKLDGSYYTLGLDVVFALGQRVSVIVGYEQPICYNNYEEHRGKAAFTWNF